MTGVFIAHQEMFGAFKYKLYLAAVILCGVTLESEVYVTVQNFRATHGLINPNLLNDGIYYNWSKLEEDAKTIEIIKDNMINNDVKKIMNYRNLVHFGEKHFKGIINATSLTHETLAQYGFNMLKNNKETKVLVEKTEDLLVQVMINYVNAINSPSLSYAYLKNKLYQGKKSEQSKI